MPGAGVVFHCGRRPGPGPHAGVRRRLACRPHEPLGPQDVRAEGSGRPLRAARRAGHRCARSPDGRRRTGARPAFGDPERAGHRRVRRSGAALGSEALGTGEPERIAPCAIACSRASLRRIEGVEVNGALEPRLPGNLNVSIDATEAETLLLTAGGHARAFFGRGVLGGGRQGLARPARARPPRRRASTRRSASASAATMSRRRSTRRRILRAPWPSVPRRARPRRFARLISNASRWRSRHKWPSRKSRAPVMLLSQSANRSKPCRDQWLE